MNEDDFLDDDVVIRLGDGDDPAQSEDRAEREAAFMEGRRPGRTYASRTFPLAGAPGVPARFIEKVFDPEDETEVEPFGEGEVWLVRRSPKGRVQIKLLIARDRGHVTRVWVQRITYAGGKARTVNVLSLAGEDAARFIELARNLRFIPVEGGDTVRVDDALLRDLFADPTSLSRLYQTNPLAFRSMIASDARADDVIALARRRREVERFRRLLDNDEYFNAQVQNAPRRKPERVWQDFFEHNPWILGTGLGGQLYTTWNEEKLEQAVAGSSIVKKGKRADALMRTSGVVRFMTFAEFKTHRTHLLDEPREYRPGVWAPSRELVGGVAQSHETVRRAVQEIGEVLRGTAADGSELPGDIAFLTRPRSFLVIGHLNELLGEGGGPHVDKIRSFESYRRTLVEPEVVTFDELLARAEWLVATEND